MDQMKCEGIDTEMAFKHAGVLMKGTLWVGIALANRFDVLSH